MVSLAIDPPEVAFALGTTTQLVATAIYSDDAHVDITAEVAWASSNAEVASVEDGVVTGAGVGNAVISASYMGLAASASIEVTAAVLSSIAVEPAHPSLAVGLALQMTAVGTFSDATTQDLSSQVAWDTSDGGVATVTPSGLVTAHSVGTADLSCA